MKTVKIADLSEEETGRKATRHERRMRERLVRRSEFLARRIVERKGRDDAGVSYDRGEYIALQYAIRIMQEYEWICEHFPAVARTARSVDGNFDFEWTLRTAVQSAANPSDSKDGERLTDKPKE